MSVTKPTTYRTICNAYLFHLQLVGFSSNEDKDMVFSPAGINFFLLYEQRNLVTILHTDSGHRYTKSGCMITISPSPKVGFAAVPEKSLYDVEASILTSLLDTQYGWKSKKECCSISNNRTTFHYANKMFPTVGYRIDCMSDIFFRAFCSLSNSAIKQELQEILPQTMFRVD